MAFLVAAGIRFAVKGVQSGIQAHKDFNSDTPPEVPRDRWGHPKDRHPVYGLVMKAESRMKGGKGKDRDEGSEDHASGEGSSGQARQSNKQEHESENYGPQTYGSKEYSDTAPPPYEAAASAPRQDVHQSGFGMPLSGEGATGQSDPRQEFTKAATTPPSELQRQMSTSTASSDSDSESDSEDEQVSDTRARPLGPDSRPQSYISRKDQKQQRRVARAQKRLDRATRRAGRNAERGREKDSDSRKISRAEWKLGNAQRRLLSNSNGGSV